MKAIKPILLLFAAFAAISCKPDYTNKEATFELTLNTDSTYNFKYKRLLGYEIENGIYIMYRDSIILLSMSHAKMDSVYVRPTNSVLYKPHPDSLLLTFRNLYEEKIHVTVSINDNAKEYKTDSLGQISIDYGCLEAQNISSGNEQITAFKIWYRHKHYVKNVENRILVNRPEFLNFTLNQFMGEDYAIKKIKFPVVGDTIYINNHLRKVMGPDNKLIKKESAAGGPVYYIK